MPNRNPDPRIAIWIFLACFFTVISGCTRNFPVPEGTPRFPPTSSLATFTPEKAPEPTAPIDPIPSSSQASDLKIDIMETGYMGEEFFIIVLSVPVEIQGLEFFATVDELIFSCAFQENPQLLYCSGPAVPENGQFRLYRQDNETPLYEVWIAPDLPEEK